MGGPDKTEMSDYNVNVVSLPVFGCEKIEDYPKFLGGTAFGIGPDVFVSASHVAKAALQYPVPCIGFLAQGPDSPEHRIWAKAPIEDAETHDDLDLALLKCRGRPYAVLPWRVKRLNLLDPVISGGFPYGHDPENLRLFSRMYSGHVSAHYPFLEFKAKPDVYELSFSAPRGLSGAPLMILVPGGSPEVVGYVFGNGKSSMLVASDAEVVREGNKETIVERYESLSYGLAVSSYSVLDVHSNLLKTTIGGILGSIAKK